MDPIQPKRQKVDTYRNRTSRLNAENSESDIDTEDHIIQRPWEPEVVPSQEELQRRHEMRKEQGRKLKELMQKKREEKNKKI